jgi:hypothetical protein
MNSKPIFRTALLATALAAGGSIAYAQPAAAAYYDNAVLETYGSTANLKVVAVGSATWKTMQPNTWSYEWPAFVRNVRAFSVPTGYVAVSPWGYGYKGGNTYSFTSSYNDLALKVESNYCWFLRTQMNSPCKTPVPSVQER